MVIFKFRTNSDAKELLKKVKKMHNITKELVECIEEKYEEDSDEDYRYDEDEDDRHERISERGGSYRRYRRGM